MSTSIEEWFSPSNIACLSEYLQACQSPEMLADLRAIAPAEALRQAAQRLSSAKRQQIKAWVLVLNSVSGVAA